MYSDRIFRMGDVRGRDRFLSRSHGEGYRAHYIYVMSPSGRGGSSVTAPPDKAGRGQHSFMSIPVTTFITNNLLTTPTVIRRSKLDLYIHLSTTISRHLQFVMGVQVCDTYDFTVPGLGSTGRYKPVALNETMRILPHLDYTGLLLGLGLSLGVYDVETIQRIRFKCLYRRLWIPSAGLKSVTVSDSATALSERCNGDKLYIRNFFIAKKKVLSA
ncbi:hypothetical protein J6590_048217 [Homalodisca vitripennis]|nr:hypothetical protein J6590_048217 [Homalodisca vitripennis]